MPKGIGRPSNRRERQAIATLKGHRRLGVSASKTGKGRKALKTINDRSIKADARSQSNKYRHTSPSSRERISKSIRGNLRRRLGSVDRGRSLYDY